jgi:ferric-dicitrate binding protein FerR (iron transport regulator)
MSTANARHLADFEPGWEELFNRFADGLATADDAQQLLDLLRDDPAARRAYREFVSLHASLQWDYAAVANHGLPPEDTAAADGRSRASRGRWIATFLVGAIISGAAAAVAFMTMTPGFNSRDDRGAESTAAASAVPLATVTNTRFASQTDPATDFEPGQPIEAGRLRILGGAIEVTLRNGVEILLEGPGELELIGELEAFLHGGTAVVRMPKGMHGFRLLTPSTEVLDLGTEFAVKYGADSATDVQVYDGAVIATGRLGDSAGRFPKRLDAGEAARFLAMSSDDPMPLPYRKDRFVRRLPNDTGIEHRVAQASPAAIAAGQTREFGRPQTEAIVVARAAGPVTIDGRFDEWALVPGVKASLDRDPAAAEWMDGRMMYDAENLYIAARVGDPHPLASTIDPTLDADDGWRGGAVQVRLSTDRALGWPVNANAPNYYKMRGTQPTPEQKQVAGNPRLSHLTMWFCAATATPCLTIAHGMMTTPNDDLKVNPSGFKGAYTRAADGRGYVMEYAIPWRLLNCESDPPQPGDKLAVAWQVLFSDEGGRLWRTQIVEVRNLDEPPRIYSWERAATWGRAEYR